MPSVTVHLRLAERVLDHWRTRPHGAPFSPGDPDAVSAFRQGAFGPDMGYVPGGHRALSDLAHCYRTGDLCRHLIRAAHTPLERAFAQGWLTHVLADALIHPLVGCVTGELTRGSPAIFVDADRDMITHVRIEAGLDAVFAARHPELQGLVGPPALRHSSSLDFVVEAYRAVYGVAPARAHFRRAHRITARRAAQGMALAQWTARLLPEPARAPVRAGEPRTGPLARFRSVVGGRSVALGYLFPILPPLWFLDSVHGVERDFVELFLAEHASDARGLPNLNLDTGRLEMDDPTHGGLRRSIDALRGLGAWPLPTPGALAGAA
jgi:hypothetical protein